MQKQFDTAGAEYVRQRMTMIGLGTYQIGSAETIHQILDAALEVGYRLVDTAQVYRNEEHIGSALKQLLPKYGLTREDIFLTSKLAPNNQGAEKCRQSVLESLEKLQTDYLDLLLIHWPGAARLKGKRKDPGNAVLRAESWRELEKLYKEKKLRAIGVSNYTVIHLDELLREAEVLPAVNQCECHPHWPQTELRRYCEGKGIHFQAYSSFGSESNRADLFNDKRVQAMAAKYGCAVTDFLLAWALAQGMSVLPRSRNPEHVKANFLGARKLRLDPQDVEAVVAEEKRMRKYCWDPEGLK